MSQKSYCANDAIFLYCALLLSLTSIGVTRLLFTQIWLIGVPKQCHLDNATRGYLSKHQANCPHGILEDFDDLVRERKCQTSTHQRQSSIVSQTTSS